jgi:hypothetical protein
VPAGQALQRVLLVATSYDLTASFLNRVLERTTPRFQGPRPDRRLLLAADGDPDRRPRAVHGGTFRRDRRDSFDQWF